MTKRFLVVPILVLTLALGGCSTSWLTMFDSYLKLAGPILISILDIAALAKGTTPNSALVAKIGAKGAALQALAAQVQQDVDNGLPTQGACTEFNAGVADFVGLVPAIEAATGVSNAATQAQINDGLAIFQNLAAEIEAPIAACQTAPTPAAAMAVVAKAVAKANPSAYVAQFNAVLDRNTGDAKVVGKTKALHIHAHGKLVRTLSVGLAK